MTKINYKKWLSGHKKSIWHVLLKESDWTYQGKIFESTKETGENLSYPQIDYTLNELISNSWVEQDSMDNLKKRGEITIDRNSDILKNKRLKHDSILYRIARDDIGIYKIISFFYHDIADTEEKEIFLRSRYFKWIMENRESALPVYVRNRDINLKKSIYWPLIDQMIRNSPKLLLETFLLRRYPSGFEFSDMEGDVTLFPFIISFLDDIVKNPEFLQKLDFNEIKVELKLKIDTDMDLDNDTLVSNLTVSRAKIF